DVVGGGGRLATVRRDPGDHGVCRRRGRAFAAVHLAAVVGDDDTRAFRCRLEGDPAADAPAAPGDRYDFAVEIRSHLSQLTHEISDAGHLGARRRKVMMSPEATNSFRQRYGRWAVVAGE